MGFLDIHAALKQLEALQYRLAVQEKKVHGWTAAMQSDWVHETMGKALQPVLDELERIVWDLERRPESEPHTPDLGPSYAAVDPVPAPRSWAWKVVPRGRLARILETARPADDSDAPVQVAFYVASGDGPEKLEDEQLSRVARAVHALAASVGATDITVIEEQRSSIWQRAWGRIRAGMASDDSRKLQEQALQALLLRGVLEDQAAYDRQQAAAVSDLLMALGGSPAGAINVGSILVVKCAGPTGDPIVLARTLTTREMKKLADVPALLRSPETVMDQLALAIYADEDEEGNSADKPA